MNILKTYTDAGALSQNGYSMMRPQRGSQRPVLQSRSTGDRINISDEAREMLAADRQNSLSVLPQDAMYDHNGHVTRQLESLEDELRHLAVQFTANPATAGMMPHLGMLRSRLESITA